MTDPLDILSPYTSDENLVFKSELLNAGILPLFFPVSAKCDNDSQKTEIQVI